MEKLLRLWRNLSIKFKLMVYFFIVIVFMGVINLYMSWNNAKVTQQFNTSMTTYYEISNLQNMVDRNKAGLDSYLASGSEASLQSYTDTNEEILFLIDKLYKQFDSRESYFSLKAIDNAHDGYTALWEKAVSERQKQIATYFVSYYSGENIYNYMQGYIQDLLYISLSEGANLYRALESRASTMGRISIVLIVAVSLFAGVIFFYFVNGFVNPIKKLADSSVRMASGDLDVEPLVIGSNDEIKQMADAFNDMSVSIRDYVKDLKQKAIIEKKLYEEELEIVKMEQLLNEAEFLALQSQINPHFLFNTLNVVSRTAMFEKADDTVKLIDALSSIFRYRLRNEGNMVSLKEELVIIDSYIYLQKVRFKDRLQYIEEVDGECLGLDIPIFSLQPLVENAMIHGIEPKVAGGVIRIKTRRSGNFFHIRVTDTGIGMPVQRLKEISNFDDTVKQARIGVSNVYHRLKLYYKDACEFKIYSREEMGTSIKIVIAVKEVPADA